GLSCSQSERVRCCRGWSRGTRATERNRAALSGRSEEHTSELQSRENLVCRLLLEKKKELSPTENAATTPPAAASARCGRSTTASSPGACPGTATWRRLSWSPRASSTPSHCSAAAY